MRLSRPLVGKDCSQQCNRRLQAAVGIAAVNDAARDIDRESTNSFAHNIGPLFHHEVSEVNWLILVL